MKRDRERVVENMVIIVAERIFFFLTVYLRVMDFLHHGRSNAVKIDTMLVVSSKVFQHFTSIADGSSMLVRIHRV